MIGTALDSLSVFLEDHLQFLLKTLAVVVVFAIVYVYQKMKPGHVPHTVPGPKRHPFLGLMPFAIKYWDVWPAECTRQSRKFNGATWGGPFPMYGAVFFTDSEVNVKHILQTNADNYVKGDMWRSLFWELLGNGIFSADGSTWESHRKISSRMFSRNLLRFSADIENSKLDQIVVDVFDKSLLKQQKVTIDIQDLFLRFTIDVTGSIAFGVELDSLKRGEQHEFALAFDEMQKLTLGRMLDPFFQVKRFFRLTARERRIRQLKVVLDDFCKGVIQSNRRSAEEGSIAPDLLSLFMVGDKDQKAEHTMTDEELRDIILNFLVAGRDTTAAALAWTFYELTKHPDVVDKIVAEVQDVCGVGDDADYSYDAMSKLVYTHAVAMEAIRLHPSVPTDTKFAVRNDVLPDGTFIPAGGLITYLPYSMGRSERLWGDDAADFKPERFLNAKEPSAFKYIMFNAGPRMCLGKPLALMSMKLVMARLLPNYNFEDVNHHSGEFDWNMVQKMKGGFVVDVTRREA